MRKNFPSRPTTDFAKENLFNVLNNQIDFEGLNVLDLFTGTGSISFEFASRGADRITSIEKDFKSVKFIKKTIVDLKFENIDIKCADAFKIIKKTPEKYDLIFADPPYDMKGIETLPDLIFENELLKDDGLFILEHSQDYDFKSHSRLKELRKYGSVHFSMFR